MRESGARVCETCSTTPPPSLSNRGRTHIFSRTMPLAWDAPANCERRETDKQCKCRSAKKERGRRPQRAAPLKCQPTTLIACIIVF